MAGVNKLTDLLTSQNDKKLQKEEDSSEYLTEDNEMSIETQTKTTMEDKRDPKPCDVQNKKTKAIQDNTEERLDTDETKKYQ